MNAEPAPHPPIVRHLLLPLLRFLSWLAFLVLGPLAIRGAYRIPRKGGVLILANHLADIDPGAVQLACRRPVHFMAKSELFQMRILGPLIKLLQAFPVKRGEPDRVALKRAAALLNLGEVVCVFPEGQLSETGELQELKSGIALIARMARAPIICLGLIGTNRIMPYGSVVPRPTFRRTHANWGEPREFGEKVTSEELLGWVEGQLRELTET